MRLIAIVGLVLCVASLAGCANEHASRGCGGCGYDRTGSYRQSTYESERYERTPGFDDRGQDYRSTGEVDRNRPDVRRSDAPAVIYTCPMHPEVVQASPGRCPKCGMELVRGRH
jgi:hypothetical protein